MNFNLKLRETQILTTLPGTDSQGVTDGSMRREVNRENTLSLGCLALLEMPTAFRGMWTIDGTAKGFRFSSPVSSSHDF